jgi:hypothetical protein
VCVLIVDIMRCMRKKKERRKCIAHYYLFIYLFTGNDRGMCTSNLPARNTAGSIMSMRLVVPIFMIYLAHLAHLMEKQILKPSI